MNTGDDDPENRVYSVTEFLPCGSAEPLTKSALEQALGISLVSFPGRYLEAFTHKSASKELNRPSYDRLEFLGDSLISFITAAHLHKLYPTAPEGHLTRIRTRMTCSATLATLAQKIGLHRFVCMSGKAIRAGWNHNPRILEDVLEALAGALYLDCGVAVVREWFLGLVATHVSRAELETDVNYKDMIMRLVQSQGNSLPEYQVEQTTVMKDNRNVPTFVVSVTANGVTGRGMHTTKKGAEQKAARAALLLMGHPLV